MCDRGFFLDTRRSAMYGMPKSNRSLHPRYQCLTADPTQGDDYNDSPSSGHLHDCSADNDTDADCQCRDRIIAVTDHEEQHIRELREARHQETSSGTTTPSTKSVHENRSGAGSSEAEAEAAQENDPIPEEYLVELLSRAKDVIPPKYIDEIARRVKRDTESPDSAKSSVTPPATSYASPPHGSSRRRQSFGVPASYADAHPSQSPHYLSPHSAHNAPPLHNQNFTRPVNPAPPLQVYTTAPYFNPLRSKPRPKNTRPISTVSEIPGPTNQLSEPQQLRAVSSSPSLKTVTTSSKHSETSRTGRISPKIHLTDRSAVSPSPLRSRPHTSERGSTRTTSSHGGTPRSSIDTNSFSQHHRSRSPSPRSSPRLAVHHPHLQHHYHPQYQPRLPHRPHSSAPRPQPATIPLDPTEKPPLCQGLPARKDRIKLRPVEPQPLRLSSSRGITAASSSSSSTTTTTTTLPEEEDAASTGADDPPQVYIRDILLKLKAEPDDSRELDVSTLRSRRPHAPLKKINNDQLMYIVSSALERSGYTSSRSNSRTGQARAPSARSLHRA